MYIPASFREADLDLLHALMRERPLGMLISAGTAGLQCSPLPFRLYPEQGVLRTHLARANPHWKALQRSECMVLFQGEQGYVTPDWYPSKAENQRAVPTWNYAVVEVRGRASIHEDMAWLQGQLMDITADHEGRRAHPWSPADAPPDYLAAQLRAIVGVEIAIEQIAGKWKMSQNRELADRHGVIAGLRDADDPHANPALAEVVASRL